MPVAQNTQLEQAVADAVRLVNNHSGQTNVTLRFNSAEFGEVDFIAHTASLKGDRFVFSSGFETFDGRLDELSHIKAEVIRH